ncbi:3-deoxy-D-manno-octulosonic acid transferase [Eisenibacter elegans]|jgi:3-deoxy-D-manno-octulosonic-acid transferase|uniref:3-deoxy-D-manno-octulosonic acid transferase n=1 Tax=Eisenibacter elegans TaxID=997 RepID=UPI00040444B7|nr:glycosyltransferase N-terminal domain-containing protein [Eisenibacter elegans]
MILFLYNCLIRLYRLAISLVAVVNPKAKRWIDGRKDWATRLELAIAAADPHKPWVWLHAASLGEFEQARPVIEAWRATHPNHQLLLTFFSPSGYEVQKNYALAEVVCYMPIDTASNARRFLDIAKPIAVFFVKYELWYHHLAAVQKRQIPLILFSATFRPDQWLFDWRGRWFAHILHNFDYLFVQDDASRQCLLRAGVAPERIRITGDTRYDRVLSIAQQRPTDPIVEAFKAGKPLLMIGSSWAEDLKVTLPVLARFQATLKVVIAPHEMSEQALQQAAQGCKGVVLRYSQATPETAAAADCLLIDNVGKLAALYQYADIAYVGGAFRTGLHNILEPAVFAIPVLFGKKYRRYSEAVALVGLGCAFACADEVQFAQHLERLYHNQAERELIAERLKQFMREHRGGTQKIVNQVVIAEKSN